MSKKTEIYWYCQILGWSFYIIINSIFLGLNSNSGLKEYFFYFLTIPTGIGISHAYRTLLIRFKILESKIPSQIVYVVVFSFLMSLVFFVINMLLLSALGLRIPDITPIIVSEQVLNFVVIFFLWNVIYFGFQYFQNYKRTEINSLRYLAASHESELNNLKAQLNPHFIFNCMNSIRALIDEDPSKAKQAVTQLSNILRNTLLIDKSKEIPLKDEMNLVNDYLELEKIRYEERLSYTYNISEESKNCLIPPFIIQTQAENAIKHGISKLPGMGQLIIEAFIEGGDLKIKVANTGKINTQTTLTGVGFKNSRQRLELLYGKQAKINMDEKNDFVIVDITIPLNGGHSGRMMS
ncbi:MAG: histidine kinase [Bacteroidia bacterium]|nr:histidine kinase [Bacteroidia bacterium]